MNSFDFIILQKSGFGLFQKYAEKKGHNGAIILAYPDSNQKKEVFNEFYASPFRTGRLGNRFDGCFAVELTEYVENPESKCLYDLAAYIRENANMTFVLFAVTDGSDSVNRLASSMDRLIGCRIGVMNSDGIVWQTEESTKKPTKVFGY
jgi:hypothetical protein